MPNPDDLEKLYKAHIETLRDDQRIEQDLRLAETKELTEKLSEPKRKPILCLDFDGVLHSYISGWKGVDIIPDPPVEGAIESIREYVKHFDVWIVSSRTGEKAGRMAIVDWLVKWGFPDDIRVSVDKPAAVLTIDDRGWMFTGVFPGVEDIKNFKPWNKK